MKTEKVQLDEVDMNRCSIDVTGIHAKVLELGNRSTAKYVIVERIVEIYRNGDGLRIPLQ